MAYNKVVDGDALDTRLRNIANKIRSKTHTTEQLNFENGDFETAIDSIQEGGGTVDDSVQFTTLDLSEGVNIAPVAPSLTRVPVLTNNQWIKKNYNNENLTVIMYPAFQIDASGVHDGARRCLTIIHTNRVMTYAQVNVTGTTALIQNEASYPYTGVNTKPIFENTYELSFDATKEGSLFLVVNTNREVAAGKYVIIMSTYVG